ncbi:MAG: DinB family protein [Bacteroidota bacterium]|nr:DinB family protein [Bacteroidota bacterium]
MNTRKMIERIPGDKLEWQPHEKSMTIGRLATHIAELPVWFSRVISANEFDFLTSGFKSQKKETTAEIVDLFDKKIAEAVSSLQTADDETMNAIFTLRRGEQVMFQLPRKVVIRNFALNHLYHHRGQLSVYLRLLDIPVPGMYGPSADDKLMMA